MGTFLSTILMGLLKAKTVILLLGLSLIFTPAMVGGQEKTTIGQVEDVILLPWGIKLTARIDTGAAVSSLDARNLVVKNNVAEFKLPKKYSDLHLRLPVLQWLTIRNANTKELRPVVEITLCIGPRKVPTRVTLTNRALVKHPLIIGRNVLTQNFVVDCLQEKCLPPGCPEDPSS